MPLYVYSCPKGHKTEELRNVNDRHQPATCQYCDREATLEVQTFTIDPRLGAVSGFPTMADKWAKARYQASKVKEQ